jgi:hypothetical protein
MDCMMITEMTDRSIAHRSVYPAVAPEMEQLVTVPGPMNAAATNAPGPTFLIRVANLLIVSSLRKIDLLYHFNTVKQRRQQKKNTWIPGSKNNEPHPFGCGSAGILF